MIRVEDPHPSQGVEVLLTSVPLCLSLPSKDCFHDYQVITHLCRSVMRLVHS